MKTYIVYVNGIEAGYVKAGSHNAAEKKAKKKYAPVCAVCGYHDENAVSMTYTEV